jgi:hypothetical protein
MPLVVGTALTMTALLPPVALAGPDWDEIGDAGKLPATAQVIFGFGTAQTIAGKLGFAAVAGDDDKDEQDMYRIVITNPTRIDFSAGTAAAFGGSATFNTRLFLFDADGFGLLANDDAGGPQSGFFDSSDDGTGIVITQPGIYFLAVSGTGSEPLDKSGEELFNIADQNEVSGPDGQGGKNPIVDWSSNDAEGEYVIGLSGVSTSPFGDLDGDGSVSGSDLGALLLVWGECLTGLGTCPADLNADGFIDGADLGTLLLNWTG